MSNLTLKEQLQSLGLTDATNEKPQQRKPVKQEKREKIAKSVKSQKPAWLEQAQYGVELLKAYFPNCFKEMKEVQPLKIGIKQDLAKYLSTREDIVIADKACMVNSLAYYVNSPAYHKRVVPGSHRIDLEGNQAGIVTEEESKYSLECREARTKKKKSSSVSGSEIGENANSE